MSQVIKRINKNIADALFEEMDHEGNGYLNLENIRRLYEILPTEFRDDIREKLRKFVIDNQIFTISKHQFLELFPKNTTPCVQISLGHLARPRIRELSPDELKNVISKRKENKSSTRCKPKFIKKNKSPSRSCIRNNLSDKILKNQDLTLVRKAYFNSLLH